MLGAGLTYVEMLSATAIRYKNKRTFEMMARHADEGILGVQVTGPSAVEVEEAVGVLSAQGFSTIDINMGCPVRKVVGAGCGSAILKDQARLLETVQRARAATLLPLSIKYRLGYTRDAVNVEETTRNGLLGAADMLTIHGRTRSESYDTPVDPAGIRRGVEALKAYLAQQTGEKPSEDRFVPLVGNGDVFCHASARALVDASGCDAVMVSRGALGNPWVFAEILAERSVNPTLAEWLEVVLEHIALHEAHYGANRTSAVLMRKHLLWYAKGFPGVKALRDTFNVVEDLNHARDLLRGYASKWPASLVRFDSLSRGEARAVPGNTAQESNSPVETSYDPKFEMDRELDRGVGHLEMA
jgi:nifR3 family TIM-barrel protein